MANQENGPEQWQTFIRWVNTPPGSRLLSASPRPQETVLTPAQRMRAEAMAKVGDQGAAFAAFAGTT